ncbi:MAG: hypothetical protein J1E56_06615 [Ruminococcus sp.]|nr:hypothetical protein [Ruminococcus sp.]
MKKLISIIISALLIFSVAILLAGCGETSISVESILKTDENFSGTRTLNIKLPSSIGVGTAISKLNSSMPDMDSYSGSITVEDISTEENPNRISYVISFSSRADYVQKVSKLLGKEITVNLATPDNILTTGTRYTEDFDATELLSWITNVFIEEFNLEAVSYNFESNVIDLDGSLFTTNSTAYVNEVEGNAIEKLTISTTNSKKNVYDRVFVFQILEDVMKGAEDKIKIYFENNTNELAQYRGWTSKGSYEEYTVIYQGLSVTELQNVTNIMLDVPDGTIEYGDFTNSSTPLSEGLTFQEKINAMNFMGKNKSMPVVEYNYSVPTNTTHGEGSVLENGSWVNKGNWQDFTYTLNIENGAENIHIPDGIQYEISGINFYLNNNGGDSFKRTVDILYAKDNQDGLSYSYNFFKNKGATVSKDETDNNFICRVETEGSALDISKKTARYFGGGNYMDYSYKQNAFDISDKTTLIDYINIGYMLTIENSEKPMTYTVTKSGEENVNRVSVDSSNTQTIDKANENGAFVVDFTGGNASVSYSGTIADWGKVTLFAVVSCIITLSAAVLAVYFIRKSLRVSKAIQNNVSNQKLFENKKRKKNDNE